MMPFLTSVGLAVPPHRIAFVCLHLTYRLAFPYQVNGNAAFYVKHGVPFVMGTTGGDRAKLLDDIKVGDGGAGGGAESDLLLMVPPAPHHIALHCAAAS